MIECSAMLEDPCVLLHDAAAQRWLRFRKPRLLLTASTLDEVGALLTAVEQGVADGAHAAGFLAYEAAPACDPVMRVRPGGDVPLAWFGLFDAPEPMASPLAGPGDAAVEIPWQASVDDAAYRAAIQRVHDHIRAGDTYQVNYTLRLRAPFSGNAWPLFRRMTRAQGAGYAAWIHTAAWSLCCASPELLFSLDGRDIVTRPMKGTAARAPDAASDVRQSERLKASEKDRAENLMIVDMARNDLGRIAETGSVTVDPLCEAERYPTVWQLTSTVRAKTDAGFAAIVRALFPAASITGAPKIRTMRIIADLETAPRGVYTGSIGFLAPGRRAQFNVAIRTVRVDHAQGTAEYGVGGGIVWDSRAASEWRECLIKARVLTAESPAFDLLETLLWRPENGTPLLDAHLARMAASAAYFNRPFDAAAVRQALRDAAAGWPPEVYRVRLLLAEDGVPRVEPARLMPLPSPYRLAWAASPVDSRDPFLYHKTTHRRVYDTARAQTPDADDTLLFNERGEATESCIGTLLVERAGRLVTPPLASGLLPGVMRARLLAEGRAVEETIVRADLRPGERVFLANAVRGIWEAVIKD
jgi:para-aminobenzoate synthetase/4-amino-4-deoxychorismate lyase